MKFFISVLLLFFMLFLSMNATPLRIIGMGSLDLIVEDESNKINLFDYGKNVAGLYDDERGSSIESYITYGRVKYSDTSGTTEPEISYWGINLPAYIPPPIDIGTTIDNLTYPVGTPTGITFIYRLDNGGAFCGTGKYSTSKTKYDSYDVEYITSWPMGSLIFSQNYGIYTIGVGGVYTRMKFSNNLSDNELSGSLMGFDVGASAHLSQMIDIGISGGFAFPDAKLDIFDEEISFNGNAFSIGVQAIAKVPGLLKFGTKINFLSGNLNRETRVGNISVDREKIILSDFNFGSRLLFSSIIFPLRVGGNFNYRRTRPVYNSELTTLFDSNNSLSITNFGLGFSYAMPLFTPGIQYNFDNLDNEETNSSKWDVRFGGEVPLTIVTLRAGYIITKDDPDTDVEDDESNSRSITFGAGIQLPLQPFKIEIAYVNKETKPVDNPDDSKETDNSLYAALKIRF